MHKAIENPENVCFKCLKEFKEDKLHKIYIPEMGWDSGFDCRSTRINLCEDCYKQTDSKWWELEEIVDEDDGVYWGSWYKYEDEIFDFVNALPVEGQELFYNRYASDALNITPQDWIDYELGILPHEKCKEYGLYSPEEKQAYQERFPICKHVQFIKYEDGSRGCHCRFGAFGNKDGTAKGHQTQSECYNCTHFEIREGKIMTIDIKEEEIKRITRQIKTLQNKLKQLKK